MLASIVTLVAMLLVMLPVLIPAAITGFHAVVAWV